MKMTGRMQRGRSSLWFLVGGWLLAVGGMASADAAQSSGDADTGERTRKGLLVFYDFREETGTVVKDRSGVGTPADLRIEHPQRVKRSQGALEIRGHTVVRTSQPPTKMADAVDRSDEITIEAWLRPAQTDQSGPARIVTLSKDPTHRNFTLGQDGDRYDVRLRTTKTSNNGIPSLSTPPGSLTRKLTHVVYTFDDSGTARIFLNGQQRARRKIGGKPSNWNDGFRLGLANEMTSDRPWQGELHLVAVYNRALSADQVKRHFAAGANAANLSPEMAARAQFFKTRVAPLLARHCLECHGPNKAKGQLDLSNRKAVLRGGSSGKVLVPGKADESLLWDYVNSDEMPKNRRPLRSPEKQILQQWINGGAVWAGGPIDASAAARREESGSTWVRRLTVPEYIETVRMAVGVDIAKEARQHLPRDLRADGFSNTAYNLNVDLAHVDAYSRLAGMIVERMDVNKFARRFTNSRKLTQANMRKLITAMGRRLLRGPLQEHEVAAFLRISDAVVKENGDFQQAVRYVIEAMLQSPRFLYRIVKQTGDGTSRPLDNYELASRLSYIVWGGPPDEKLLQSAEAGRLADPRHARAQVKRMLQHPRAVRHSSRFLHEWLHLDRLENLRPDAERFPHWNAGLAEDMRRETQAFSHEVLWKQKRPFSALLNAQVTFLTPRLAKHYGLKPKAAGAGRQSDDPASGNLVRYDLSQIPSRGGLLTQGSVLTIGGDEASMVTRGLFVLHNLLDGEVSDPPPGVDTTPVPPKPGLSQRAIAKARIANKSCGGCHSKFEPLAFGLEKFDGLGTYHETDEHDNTLRDDGEILFPGKSKPVAYQSSAEMMDLLAGSDRVKQTLTRKLVQWAVGRPLVKEDEPIIERIHRAAWAKGGTYQDLMTALVMSDLVRKTRTEPDR